MAIPSVYPNLFGDFDSRDLERPAAEVPQPELYDQIARVLAMYSELALDVVGLLAVTTTVAKERFAADMGNSDTGLLQMRAEYGRPLATRITQAQAETAFEVGYPIYPFADRAMFTPEFLQRNPVREVNNKTVDALIRDYNTLFRYVLAAIFDNVNYAFEDDAVIGQNLGQIEVKRLLNADGIPGVIQHEDGTTTTLGTANAYKVSGTAAYTNGTFVLAHNYLKSLGMDRDIVHCISKADETAVSLLSDFVTIDSPPAADPNIIEAPTLDVNGNPIPPPPRSLVRAPRAIGRVRSADNNSGEVVVIPWMPAGYLFSFDRAAEKPVVIRESDLAGLRGFRLVSSDNMTPEIGGDKLIVNKYWQRIFGAGVRNRANGCIVQVTTNGAYTAPSFFLM
jgi:hypothetical protein